jgi:hypothetical protein
MPDKHVQLLTEYYASTVTLTSNYTGILLCFLLTGMMSCRNEMWNKTAGFPLLKITESPIE